MEVCVAGQYKQRILNALEKFDVRQAEKLSDALHEAELAGYQLTKEEDQLWERLTRCIEMYRRNLAING